MAKNHVMANVMTPSLSQVKFREKLLNEVGHTRSDKPFTRLLCLNSGSESVTIAARISDLHAKIMTDQKGRHHGKAIKLLSLKGSFHGRTDRPAQASDSTMKACSNLASFRDRHNLVTVEPNNVEQLQKVFAEADADNVYFEMMLMEPVMGEGDPGKAITREFYQEARRLTRERGTLLLIDSIQAGLRAHGVLSFTDYPGMRDLDPPDMETYSKALNAGQYPLSVLALSEETAKLYRTGVYGNTMTTNPRALEVACAVLDSLNDQVRANITERGREFLDKFSQLQKEYPDAIKKVQGTGLLFAVSLDSSKFPVVGFNGVEQYLRRQGIGVIHGGENALRFTPHFQITSAEVDLIVNEVGKALQKGSGFSRD